jgi:hypothetical protein
MFTNADASLTVVIFDIINENCISFYNWNVIKAPPTCTTCVDAICGDAFSTLSNYSILKGSTALTTTYSNGLKIEDDTTNN